VRHRSITCYGEYANRQLSQKSNSSKWRK